MKMATASATTSISSAMRINPVFGVECRARHADRLVIRIFPRPAHRRPRRSGRWQRGRSRASTASSSAIRTGAIAKADVHVGTFAIEHQFSDALTLRNRTLYGDYDKFYQNIYPGDLNEATRMVTLAAYHNRNDRRNLFSQTDLIWNGKLGGIDQTLLVGLRGGAPEIPEFPGDGHRSRQARMSSG